MHPTPKLVRLAAPYCVTVALLACVNDLVLPGTPADGGSLTIAAVRGDGQTGTVGEPLPVPLAVRVTTTDGQGVRDQQVAFLRVSGADAGALIPDTAMTEADGAAEVLWVLGPTVGAQTVEARLVVTDTNQAATTRFSADAASGAPDDLVAVSGGGQRGAPGFPLSEPLVVRVTDRFGNPVGDALTEWRVDGGSGRLSAGSARTGSDGRASVQWTLGLSLEAQRASASVSGVGGSVTFEATYDIPSGSGNGDGSGGGNGDGSGNGDDGKGGKDKGGKGGKGDD